MIYTGARSNTRPDGSAADGVVMSPKEDILDERRYLYAKNWYTSVPLAESLLQRKACLTGKCKKSRHSMPKEVMQEKLQNDE